MEHNTGELGVWGGGDSHGGEFRVCERDLDIYLVDVNGNVHSELIVEFGGSVSVDS